MRPEILNRPVLSWFSVLMLGLTASGMSLSAHAQTAPTAAAPTGVAGGTAASASPNAFLLRGLLIVGQDPGAPSAPPPAAAARDVCRPLPAQATDASQATPVPLDAAALRLRLAQVPASAADIEHIASGLPAMLPGEAISERLASYVGRPIDAALTAAIVSDVVAAIQKDARYLADVYFPAQNSSDAILTLVVRPAVLGKVTAKGQQFHEARDIECRVRAAAGQPVDLKVLAGDLAQLNSQSSWRYTDAPEFTPGAQPGTTDLTLNTRDEKPLRYFFGADNTGTRSTGLGRYRAGVNIGNFLGNFDHQLDYTLVSASGYNRYADHGLVYQMPLEDRQRLTARLNVSQSDVTLQNGLFRAQGDNQIASLEWTRPQLEPIEALNWGNNMASTTSLGVEYKRIGNSLAFNQVVLSSRVPEVLQVFGSWRAAWQGSLASLGSGDQPAQTSSQLYTRLTLSPGGLLGSSNNETFDAVRPGAKATYWRANAAYNGQLQLPSQWSLGLNVNAQAANKPLISSERTTLSGWGGVRGYYSDTLSADAGITGALELLSPRMPLDIAGQTGTWHALAFVDAGRSWNATPEFNADLNRTGRTFSLASHGVGLRYETSKNSHVRVDVARRHIGLDSARGVFWHASWQVAF